MTAPTPNAELALGWRPATDSLLADLADCVRKVREHQHPERGEDLYCLNLTSYMGERMGAVLKRLDDERAKAVEPRHADADADADQAWRECAHRADYASAAEHERNCAYHRGEVDEHGLPVDDVPPNAGSAS